MVNLEEINLDNENIKKITNGNIFLKNFKLIFLKFKNEFKKN